MIDRKTLSAIDKEIVDFGKEEDKIYNTPTSKNSNISNVSLLLESSIKFAKVFSKFQYIKCVGSILQKLRSNKK